MNSIQQSSSEVKQYSATCTNQPDDPLDFSLADVAELDPNPTPAHTKAYQPNALKTQTSVKVRTQPRRPNMLQAALRHAERGLYIFPAHVPLFNENGKCTGCTCEHNKRGESYHQWLIEHGRGHEYDPDYKCNNPGKCPAVSWAKKSTNDKAQINKWWGRQWKSVDVETGKTIFFYPNIAVDCGKSGLLVLDEDAYKQVYGDLGDLLSPDEQETVKQLSGSHKGTHLLYAMPAGKAYGNATGDLPKGFDIRGVGGYIIVEPSLHKSGNRYEWLEGYGLGEIELQIVPEALQAILDNAQQKSASATHATFTTVATEKPSLIRWYISKDIRELIHNPPPEGKRSEADYSVCLSLVYAGATDDDIHAVFQHYPIGTEGKYAASGDQYLARTIGKARAWADAHPRPDIGATLDLFRLFIKTHNLADRVGPGPGSKKLRPVVDGVFDLMQEDARFEITAGKKRLGKVSGVSPNTVVNVLALVNGGLFDVTPTANGFVIRLVEESRLQKFDPSLSVISVNKGGQKIENDKNAYSPNKATEPFLTGTSRYMRERFTSIAKSLDITVKEAKQYPIHNEATGQEEYTYRGLGEGVLLAFDTWQRIGDFTAKEYAKETGLKLSAARAHLRRSETMGLADSYREGSHGPKVYSFVPEFWQRVEELAPTLHTYTSGSQRENKRLESAQQWCKKDIEETKEAIAAAQLAHDPEAEQAARDKKKALDARFEGLGTQRLPHLKRLHPDLSKADIYDLAYKVDAYKRSTTPSATVRTARSAMTAEHRYTVQIIRELAEYCMDVDTPAEDIYNHIMQFGTFDADMVKAVLQSPRQMSKFETLDQIRKRAEHEAIFAGLRMTPVTPSYTQTTLGGAA